MVFKFNWKEKWEQWFLQVGDSKIGEYLLLLIICLIITGVVINLFGGRMMPTILDTLNQIWIGFG